MKIKQKLVFLTVFITLISCNGLDNDEAFLYAHKATFLINNQNKVFQCFKSNELKIKFLLENVQDGNILKENVYFLDTIHKELIVYTQPFEFKTTKKLAKPYAIISGWNTFQVLSNKNETLLEKFSKKKKESLSIAQGAEYLFCNQGRFWLVQNKKVIVYDLNTGSELETFPLQRDFEFADFNRGFNLLVYTKDSLGLYQKSFDTNAISSSNEVKVNFQKIQHTKVLTRLYETEYLKNVELNAQNQLNIPGFSEEVHSFDMDFQSSRLFYTRNDSLFVYDLLSNKKQFMLENFGTIKKGLHFYSQN